MVLAAAMDSVIKLIGYAQFDENGKVYSIVSPMVIKNSSPLAGVDGVVVHTYEEVKQALETAVSDREIGILLVAEKLSTSYPELFHDIKLTNKTPLIVEIPDRHGSDTLSAAIAEYVREAVGIKI